MPAGNLRDIFSKYPVILQITLQESDSFRSSFLGFYNYKDVPETNGSAQPEYKYNCARSTMQEG